jgi:hypothetical protein
MNVVLILPGLSSLVNHFINDRIQHAIEQRDLVSEIRRSEGSVSAACWTSSSGELVWIALGESRLPRLGPKRPNPPGPEWLLDLFGEDVLLVSGKHGTVGGKGNGYYVEPLTKLDHLEGLYFGGWADITPTDADHLLKAKGLRSVTIGKSRLKDAGLTDAGLANLSRVGSIEELELDGTQVSDKSLASLRQLRKLKSLRLLRNRNLTDEAMREIGGIATLESLTVNCLDRMLGSQRILVPNPITDAGLVHLKTCTNLHELVLDNTWVSGTAFAQLKGVPLRHVVLPSANGAVLSALSELPQLETLSLANAMLRNAAIGSLLRSRSIRNLDLTYTWIRDNSIEDLSGMPNLRELNLTRNNITDEGVAYLAKLPRLQVLSLANTGVTDTALSHLAAFPAIRELDIRNTKITRAGLQQLRAIKSLTVLKVGGPITAAIDADFVRGLRRLPQLRRLYMPMQSDEDCELLATGLPNLEIMVPAPWYYVSVDKYMPMPRPKKKPAEKQ